MRLTRNGPDAGFNLSGFLSPTDRFPFADQRTKAINPYVGRGLGRAHRSSRYIRPGMVKPDHSMDRIIAAVGPSQRNQNHHKQPYSQVRGMTSVGDDPFFFENSRRFLVMAFAGKGRTNHAAPIARFYLFQIFN